jgi:hypothetical protein
MHSSRREHGQAAAEGGTLLYFAYGSNMSLPRLAARIGSVRKTGVARLPGHALRFHKAGRDGSAKCDVHATGDPRDEVFGVLFEIEVADRAVLDRFEGRGRGYEVKTVQVLPDEGEARDAFTYYATHIDPDMQPYHWYKAHVLHGAVEHVLPDGYLAAIHAVEAVDDPNHVRHAAEMAIYRREHDD